MSACMYVYLNVAYASFSLFFRCIDSYLSYATVFLMCNVFPTTNLFALAPCNVNSQGKQRQMAQPAILSALLMSKHGL